MGMGEAEQRAAIEEHLPLVRHIVFQVAVHFPRHVDRDELARLCDLRLQSKLVAPHPATVAAQAERKPKKRGGREPATPPRAD